MNNDKVLNVMAAMLSTKLETPNTGFVDQSFSSSIHCRMIEREVVDDKFYSELKYSTRNRQLSDVDRAKARFELVKYVNDCLKESATHPEKHNFRLKYQILKWTADKEHIIPSHKDFAGEKFPILMFKEFYITSKEMMLAMQYDLLEPEALTEKQHEAYKLQLGTGWKFKCKGILYDLSRAKTGYNDTLIKAPQLYLKLERFADYIAAKKTFDYANYIGSFLTTNDQITGAK